MDNKDNYFISSNKIYMIIIAVTIIIIFAYGHIIVGSIILALYGILIIYNLKDAKLKKDQWIQFIEGFSSKLDIVTKNTLINSPFPLILIGGDGSILWYNLNIFAVVKDEDILGEDIGNIIGKLNVKKLMDGKTNVEIGRASCRERV